LVHEHLKGLRLDRRALRRRSWISSEELEKELAALPDAASKVDDSVPAASVAEEKAAERSRE
jgi:hypothetical protein